MDSFKKKAFINLERSRCPPRRPLWAWRTTLTPSTSTAFWMLWVGPSSSPWAPSSSSSSAHPCAPGSSPAFRNAFTKMIYLLCVFSMVVPFQMVMFTLSFTADRLGLNTPWGIIIIYLGFGAGTRGLHVLRFCQSIPVEIEEAALIDGCTPLRTFFSVVPPYEAHLHLRGHPRRNHVAFGTTSCCPT